ncbi:hypothetical protein G5714_024570 [Onychostoma macrolepis]|uniref:Uncharacterized protein n=1 Tax=Onychostoma macrolepis TaxID=369639 RepID=A0A7J6BHP4_9TELE|nr:hypothetical protein G5714_024570 [Onychostoma macrolepis]
MALGVGPIPGRRRQEKVWSQRCASAVGGPPRWRGSLGAGRGPSPSDGGLARGRCEAVAAPPRRVRFFLESGCLGMQPKVGEGVKPLRGKRVGSARSAGGFNPAGPVGPVGARGSPVGTAARPLARPPSAHFFRGGARDRLGLARKGRAKVARSLRVMSFTEPPRSDFAAYPGSWAVSSRLLSSRRGGAGPLAPGVCVDRRTVLSPSPTAPAPSGRGSGPRKGCSRSAAVGHPPDPS